MAADPPQAEISNGVVSARLYLPDAQDGYYRATRFDWSGQVASVEYKGHKYFGQWFEKSDPKHHDSHHGSGRGIPDQWRRPGLCRGETRRELRQDRSGRHSQARRAALPPVQHLRHRGFRQVDRAQGPRLGRVHAATARHVRIRVPVQEDAAAHQEQTGAGARTPPEEHRQKDHRVHGVRAQLLHDRRAAHGARLSGAIPLRRARHRGPGRSRRDTRQGNRVPEGTAAPADGPEHSRGLRRHRRKTTTSASRTARPAPECGRPETAPSSGSTSGPFARRPIRKPISTSKSSREKSSPGASLTSSIL